MNCFNHNEKSAHGICRVCGRGVCSDCTTDLGHSLACRDRHEESAEAMHALTLRSTKLLKVSRKSIFLAPLFYGVFGTFFFVDGFRQPDQWNFASMMGAAFILFGLAVLVTNIRAYGGKTPSGS